MGNKNGGAKCKSEIKIIPEVFAYGVLGDKGKGGVTKKNKTKQYVIAQDKSHSN